MQVKTITTVTGVNEIDFGNDDSQSTAHFYWLKNLGDSALYVSANPNPIAEKDDVAELPAKGAVSVETDEGKVYILGAGKVEIHRTNSKFCPFDWQSSGSSGGGGGSITVDSELSDTSTNPLQNKVTTAAINEVNSTVDALRDDVLANTAALETKSDINHIHDISASGNPVIMDNLQGGVPFSEMVVSGKNLIGPVQAKALTGDNTNGFFISDSTTSRVIVQKLQPNTTYHIKKYDSGNRFRIVMFNNEPTNAADTTAIQLIYKDDGSISDYTLTTGEDHLWMVLATNYATSGEVIEPIVQLELGTTATAYEPPITGRELTVNVSGKNLLNNKLPTITSNGVTATVNDDGSVTINRTESSDSNAYLIIWDNIPARYVANQKIVINAIAGQSITTCYMGIDRLENGAYIDRIAVGLINNGVGIVTQEDIDNDRIFRPWIFIHKDYAPSNLIVYPQLELGDTTTEYEPYHGSTTTIVPTSNPCIIPNDISQQDGLNVVSVSEGELSVVGVQKNAAMGKLYTDLKPVAFSGSYNDLGDKPEIPTNSDITASGNPVQINNLQDGVPFSEITVSGKNLIGIAQAKVLGGNENSGYNVTDSLYSRTIIQKLQPNTTYTVKKYDSGNRFRIVLFNNEPSTAADITAKQLVINTDGSIMEYTFATDTAYLWFAFTTHSATSGDAVEPIAQLELGTTATAYEPPITGRDLTVEVSGKNIIAQPFFIEQQGGTLENNGIAYTLNADKSITASGTATADSYCTLQHITMSLNVNRLKKNTDYFLSGSPVGSGTDTYQIYAGIYDNDGNRIEIYHDYGSGALIRIANDYRCTTSITIKKGQTVSNLIFRPQLELGDTPTEYEPYHGSATTITPTSNPYTVPDSIRQQDGYNVISVSEGEISVTGVRKDKAIKRIWDEFASNAQRIDDLDTTVNTTLSAEIEKLKAENQALHTEIKELWAIIEPT